MAKLVRPKLPRTHKELEAIKSLSYFQGTHAAKTETVKDMSARIEAMKKHYEGDVARERRQAIESLTKMAQAIAELGRSLSNIVEPGQI